MTHVLVQPQHQATFASPPPNGSLPYPSYTPYPSRTATPSIAQALAQTASSSSSSNNTLPSAHSFGTSSLSRWKSWRSSNSSKSKNKYHNNIASSVGHTPRLPRRRSQTAPWKTPATPSAPPPYRHGDTIININRDTDGSNKMAYYGYYQQQAPNWATAQYEPIAPPMTYHPTPNYDGLAILDCFYLPHVAPHSVQRDASDRGTVDFLSQRQPYHSPSTSYRSSISNIFT
ncbi:10120_t:CDS:2, partial [Acaulospora colombiana]